MSTQPQTTVKGLTFFPPPTFTDLELAFGAPESSFFDRNDLPYVPSKYIALANQLFFKGGDICIAPVVDHEQATRALRAWLGSFAPAHEAKETTVGYALWLWSTPAALELGRQRG